MKRLLFLVITYIGFLFSSTYANQMAENFLIQSNDINSSMYTENNLVTPFQGIATVLINAKKLSITLDSTFEQNAMLMMHNSELNNTYILASKIILNTFYDETNTSLVSFLLERQNQDGGFGEFLGFNSTVIDTSIALEAMSSLNTMDDRAKDSISYLLNEQQTNGSWGEGSNENSIYLTACAMHALWLYRYQYDIASQLEQAKTFLESQKNEQLWGELHQSAQVLIAIAPMYSSIDDVQESINAINLLQKANGSWENNPYTTALLLRATTIATVAVPNPDLGSIKGIVIDADSTEPIPDVDITLKKEKKSYYLTDNNGLFEIVDLEAGEYELIIGKNGYSMIVDEITLQQGQQLDFGTLRLSKYVAPTSGAIQGRIVDGLTKEPLIQVQIKVGELSTYTNADGTFSLNTIPVGPISISFEKDGYANAIAEGESIAGITSLYSIEMVPINQVSSGFNLTVIDAMNSQVISDVNLTLSGAMNQEFHNIGEGIFNISPVIDGDTTFTISALGYATQTLVATLRSGTSYQHTVKMQPINKSITLFGKVQSNNANAIANVKVSIPKLGLSTKTDTQGNFNFTNLESGNYTIEFSHASYFDISGEITLKEGLNYQLPITLYPITQKEPIIEGHLVDIQTGESISGEVSISGDFSATVTTNSEGYYSYTAPNDGNVTLSIVSAGYVQKEEHILVPTTGIVSLRHELYATSLNPSKFRLHLIEAISQNVMQDVNVNFFHSGYKGQVTTDAEGNIEINQIIGSSLVVDIEYPGYEEKHLELELFEGEERDYGTISLFKQGITKLQPDLIIKEASYQEENISVGIENQGSAIAVPSTLIAFYDNNGNSQYDNQADTLIAKKVLPVSLQAYDQYNLILEKNILNSHEDMPISLQIDSENVVLENNESNNFALLCHGVCQSIATTYTANDDFALGESINVKALASHQLQLDEAVQTFDVIWVSSSGTGTIVKIDTKTGKILGEYRSAPSGRQTNPSRTTVDKDGNVWAGNRNETSGKGSVVKIGLVENGQCIDRNGNGIIDTSTGLNDIKPWSNTGGVDNNGGVSTAEDECILHYVRVGGTGVRHVSVDAENNVWVGGHLNRVFNVIDGESGKILQSVTPSCGGYGGLMDRNGVLWSATRQGGFNLLRYDTKNTLTDLSDDTYTCQYVYGSYGLGLDSQGNIWHSSYSGNKVYKFAADGTSIGNYSTHNSYPSGLTIGLDDDIWTANRGPGTMARLDNNGTYKASVYVGSSPTGAATDSQGKIWVSVNGNNKFVRIDPTTNKIDLDVKLRNGSAPYNYSDMTGSLLSGKPDSGTWSIIQDSKHISSSWGRIIWNGYTPEDAVLKVSVATSDDNISFGSAQLLSNGDLVNLQGRYLKVMVNFERSTNGTSPVLYDLSVEPQAKDYSLSGLKILDNSENYSINVNVHNLGSIALEATRVHFFNGDPKNGGILLGVADVPTLAVNGSSNITLTGIENIGENNIFAIVDYTMEINECDEDNNIVSIPFGSSNVLGKIDPHTDKLTYGVDENVSLYANITNPGRLSYELNAQLILEDIDGNVVHTFEVKNLGVVASQEIKTISESWNTEKTLTGTYRIKGVLLDTEGNIVDESYTTFTIASGVSIDASLRLQTDKTTYDVTDTIEIEDVVQNLTTNALLPETTLHLTVKDSASQVVYDETLALNQLAPQAMQTFTNY
uniref:carboxypeptidase regulatory-like domain-containing protein n=2 Tax=Sulfurimonas sp. TaxID=2022749 RepID=UPI003D0CF05F